MAIDVTVRDFQSIRAATLVLDGLTVVVGPSDRGKSALLRAIEAALFNRSGTQFVRYGAKSAEVGLAFPVNGTSHRVMWTKGKDVNRFKVDEEDYAKAGKIAPEVLKSFGFRDIVIGAKLKDDGKLEGGETIRPQIAKQFDRIFLLDETGSFLNEVLVGLSRLSVLQRAGRICGGDLRTAKSLLKTRQGDYEAALAARDRLAPVVELQARVDALAGQQRLSQALGLQVSTLAQRILQRARARMVLAFPVPVAHAALPQALITRVSLLQGQVRARKVYQQQLTVTIPPLARPATDADRVLVLRPLVAERRALRAQLQTSLPKPRVIRPKTTQLYNHWHALRPMVLNRRQQLNWAQEGLDKAERSRLEHDNRQRELQALLDVTPVCPVCERPWP